MAWNFEQVAGPYGGPTDGPVWDGSGVLFTVAPERTIRRFDAARRDAAVVRQHCPRTKGLALGADGTLYGCQAGSRRITRFNKDGSATPLRALLDGALNNCPDDLVIDRQGRIWFTDPYDSAPALGPDVLPMLDFQAVLRLEGSEGAWQLTRMTSDTTSPRGIALSADEQTLFVSDVQDLRAYPVEGGNLGAGRVLHSAQQPLEGLCLDGGGNIVACAGSELLVVSPGGEVLATERLPEDKATNCAFGGSDLYVTTEEGRLFQARP